MHSTSTTANGPATEEMLAAAEMVQPLSEANLAEHLSTQTTDKLFEECHIRQEGFQLFDRACCASIYECDSERSVGSDGELIDVEIGIESISRQYQGPRASSATVMHRFAFVSPQTESFRLVATNALNSCHIDEGSLDAANLRADAARNVATIEAPSESDSAKAVTSEASFDSDSNYVEALKPDSGDDNEYDEPEDMNFKIENAVTRCPVRGRARRHRIQRIRREADETANKRRRVEQG